MMLNNTRIFATSFSKKIDVNTFCNDLTFLKSHLTIKKSFISSSTESVVIWLLFLDSGEQIQSFNFHHANHESMIFIVGEKISNLQCSNAVSFDDIENNPMLFEQILLLEEQKILQRHIFHASHLNKTLFEQFGMYGQSSGFNKNISHISKFAKTDENIHIHGETGTGKELTARSIHYLSLRQSASFIPINCGAFSDELILSELFGYEKGAFTGATQSKKGLLEIANNGTIFLDEIDSLSLRAQVALLRFLQESEIRPIGSSENKTINVRVITASNQCLNQLVINKKFREDLFYRLDVLRINLLPLRERMEDVLYLAQHILTELNNTLELGKKYFSRNMLSYLLQYSWPGNIRELENFIKRNYLLSSTDIIDSDVYSLVDEKPLKVASMTTSNNTTINYNNKFVEEKHNAIMQFEKDYLNEMLIRAEGNVSKAAALASKERRSFCRLMEKHGLTKDCYIESSN